MIKALKVTMVVWGVLGILFGLAYILIPKELGEMFGYTTEAAPEYLPAFLVSLGVTIIASSVFVIAAARDPLKHILWVKFAILSSLLSLVGELYSVVREYVSFGQATMGIVLFAVFAAAFLIFYPWRVTKGGQ